MSRHRYRATKRAWLARQREQHLCAYCTRRAMIGGGGYCGRHWLIQLRWKRAYQRRCYGEPRTCPRCETATVTRKAKRGVCRACAAALGDLGRWKAAVRDWPFDDFDVAPAPDQEALTPAATEDDRRLSLVLLGASSVELLDVLPAWRSAAMSEAWASSLGGMAAAEEPTGPELDAPMPDRPIPAPRSGPVALEPRPKPKPKRRPPARAKIDRHRYFGYRPVAPRNFMPAAAEARPAPPVPPRIPWSCAGCAFIVSLSVDPSERLLCPHCQKPLQGEGRR